VISSGGRLTSALQAVNSFNPVSLSALFVRLRLTRHRVWEKEWLSAHSKLLDLKLKVEEL